MRVLIVEDHAELADVLYECLKDFVTPRLDIAGIAYDGVQAVQMISEREPDVVLLDIIMPKLDGLGVMKQVNSMKLGKKPQFVIISAIGNNHVLKQAMNLGAKYYLIKPFNVEAIESLFEKLYTSFGI
jgi:two-component system response regulator (stage 0 sporulation protein A)